MKRIKLKRKVCAMALSLAMVVTASLSVSLTIFAEPLTYSDKGVYKAEEQTATQKKVDEGDTDNQLKKTVQAQIRGGSIDYFISVEFGDMQFEYNYGPQWDAVNHQYISTDAAGWNYDLVTAANCKINVTNYSNFPVLADFSYESTFDFNENPVPTNKYAVDGVFNTNITTLKTMVQQNLVDPAQQAKPTLKLRSCDECRVDGLPYYYTSDDASLSNTGTAFFALMGTPDAGIDSLGSFDDVGSVTVTITPATGVSVGTYTP